MKQYVVELTAEEQDELMQLVSKGKAAARKITHARVLLQANESKNGPAWTDNQISEAFDIHTNTIHDIRRRFVEDGLEAALERKPTDKPPRDVRFDGAFEAKLIALACSDAPEGQTRWTVRLLADKAVELNFAESVSHMTVQRVLKKTNLSLISASTGKSRRKGTPPL